MQLVKYDAACKAIAEAKIVDEVKNIIDKSAAMQAYARQVKNKDAEIDMAEIRLRAKRRLGEMLIEQKETVGMARPAIGSKVIGDKRVPMKDTRPTLADVGIDKKLSSESQKIASVPEKEFEQTMTEWKNEVSKVGERVHSDILKKGDKEKKDIERKENKIVMPSDVFDVIYADPPWQYNNSGFEMSAEKQYPTMSTDDIVEKINFKSNKDSVLFLWATNPLLSDALDVINGWGFEYKTNFVWVKEKHTAGFYVFGQHELLLIATKGSKLPVEKYKSIIQGENKIHSKKPECAYEMIEKMYPEGKYLELFARDTREGWQSYGNDL